MTLELGTQESYIMNKKKKICEDLDYDNFIGVSEML